MDPKNLKFKDSITAFFQENSLNIPMEQVLFLVLVISVFMIIKKYKIGHMVAYFFIFYWVFIMQRSYFLDVLQNNPQGKISYNILGLAMLIVMVVGFLQAPQPTAPAQKSKTPPKLFFKIRKEAK